jgi:hypothetical protein
VHAGQTLPCSLQQAHVFLGEKFPGIDRPTLARFTKNLSQVGGRNAPGSLHRRGVNIDLLWILSARNTFLRVEASTEGADGPRASESYLWLSIGVSEAFGSTFSSGSEIPLSPRK